MAESHTKGPWKADDRGHRVHGIRFFWLVPDKVSMGTANAADAHLAAAAPDMLADLIEAERMFRWYGDMHAAKPDMDKAQRNYLMADRLAATIAIAKATPTDTKPAGEGDAS